MERIGVDHIARASGTMTSGDSSLTAESMLGNFQAVQMLSKRLRLLLAYVEAVISGELPPNWPRLREIRALLSRIPHVVGSGDNDQSRSGSRDALLKQANDVCLSALLGGITQALHTLHYWLCLQKALPGSGSLAQRRMTGGKSISATASQSSESTL